MSADLLLCLPLSLIQFMKIKTNLSHGTTEQAILIKEFQMGFLFTYKCWLHDIQRTAALIVEFGSCFSLRKENAWPGLNTLLQKVLPALTISEPEKNVLAVYVALILRGCQDRTAICEVA